MPSERLQLLFDFVLRGKRDMEEIKRSLRDTGREADRARPRIDRFKSSVASPEPIRAVGRLNREFRELGKLGRIVGRDVGRGFSGIAGGIAGSIVKAELFVGAMRAGFRAVKQFTIEAAFTAARTETLGVALESVARLNAINVIQTRRQEAALKSLGITTQGARQVLARFAATGLPIERVTELADLARNLAVIMGTNTSEAFERLTRAIIQQEVEILRTAGLNVRFEDGHKRMAEALGKTTSELTSSEKRLANFNVVVAENAKVMGTYEAAIETTGKKITSLPRLFEEAQNAIGSVFAPALGQGVDRLSEFLKFVDGTRRSLELLNFVILSTSDPIRAAEFLQERRTRERFAGQLAAAEFQKETLAPFKPRIETGPGGPTVRSPFIDKSVQGFEDRLSTVLAEQEKAEKARAKRLEQIASLERRAALAGVTSLERLNIERQFAIELLGKQADEINRINAAFDRLRSAEVQETILRVQSQARAALERETGVNLAVAPTPREQFEASTQTFRSQLRAQIEEDKRAVDELEKLLDEDSKKRREIADFRANIVRQEADARVRLIELTRNEFEAVREVAQARIQAALEEFRILGDQKRLIEELNRVQLEGQVRVAELQRRQIEEFRNAAGSAIDALTARGAVGLQDFFRAQVLAIRRTIAVNLAEEVFRTVQSRVKLEIPGQRTQDAQGNTRLTPLGRILRGTPFGVDPQKFALDSNTSATTLNTAALTRTTASLDNLRALALSDSGGGGAAKPTEIESILGPVFKRSADSNKDAADANKESAERFAGLSKILTIGGVAAGAGFGVRAGIRQGGAGGALTAAGSALTAAALIPGPQQPFVAGGAAIASLLGGLFGGPSAEDRARKQQEALEANRFQFTDPANRSFNLRGDEVEVNAFRGQQRVLILEDHRTININAVDSRSILDRKEEIAEAVRLDLAAGGDLSLDLEERFLGR